MNDQSPPSVAAGITTHDVMQQAKKLSAMVKCVKNGGMIGQFEMTGAIADALPAERARVEKLREALKRILDETCVYRVGVNQTQDVFHGNLAREICEAALNEDNHGGEDA